MGNMTGAGAKILGSDACRRAGCTQVTAAENRVLHETIRKEQIADARQRG